MPTLSIDLTTIDCIDCGMVFAVPRDWERHRRRSHKAFWCPGCKGGMCYSGKSELEKLRDKNEFLKKDIDHWRDKLHREREAHGATGRNRSAIKGQLTRLKVRAANGVCPCCKRTFRDLARHMGAKHPGYGERQ